MATATILHVGEDVCFRIPVIEHAGLFVVRSECSADSLQAALTAHDSVSAIAFQNDVCPPESTLVSTARKLSTAPVVLFHNPHIECDALLFDVVIDVHDSPVVWLKSLQEAIRDARNVRDMSQRLRQECSELRSASLTLQEESARIRKSPIDSDALWRDGHKKG